MKKQTFYYHFNKMNAWTLLNIWLFLALGEVILFYPEMVSLFEMQMVLGALGVSILLWGYKYLYRIPVAVVTDETIKIDHCAPLKWKDIKAVKETVATCGGMNKKILVLEPKKNIKYKYNFLQKHNCDFTPFSIPLYGIIRPKDLNELRKIIEKKVK